MAASDCIFSGCNSSLNASLISENHVTVGPSTFLKVLSSRTLSTYEANVCSFVFFFIIIKIPSCDLVALDKVGWINALR